MKAITTKSIAATNTKPEKVKAFDEDGNSYTTSAGLAQTVKDTHKIAALGFMHKYDWKGEIIGGSVKGGYVWVFTP